ncbi:hypothetical protein [Rhodococcus opacus]|uniref:hypothetical protein n=1 Tax=Rhodococcus opacus TaxID=37919 RepID=UPI0024BA380A|nr:hypothetical protein [Rhodococcus opacus]MDJ0420344.1 hypothetical protein [Rhodococcus opacus]
MAHTTIRRTAVAALAATTLLVGATACAENDAADPAVELTVTGAPAFEGPNGADTSNKTPDELAQEQALAKVNDFYAVLGKVEADPGASTDMISGVAGDPVLAGRVGDITLRRSQGITSAGAIAVVTSTVSDMGVPVDKDGEPLTEPAWVHVRACTDISGWTTSYPDGTSAMKPDRGRFESTAITVRNPAWPDSNGWRVTSQTVEKVPSCDQ